jgi:thymidylate synthase
MLKVRDHRLEWMQIIRSNDLFLGVPYNFVQFTYLQEILAGWLRVELGSYNQISDSLHVYETSMNEVLSSKVVRVATNTDALIERKDVSEHFFKELSERIHRLASLNTSQVDLASIANWSRAPIAYRNMLLVMVAEAARKKKMLGMASDAIGACTNPALVQQWEGWFARTNTKANLSKAR